MKEPPIDTETTTTADAMGNIRDALKGARDYFLDEFQQEHEVSDLTGTSFYSTPEAQHLFEEESIEYSVSRDQAYTDLGNAKKFCDHYGANYRVAGGMISEDKMTWYKWDKKRWKRDTTTEHRRQGQELCDLMTFEARLGMQHAQKMIAESMTMGDEGEFERAKKTMEQAQAKADWAAKSEATGKITAMLKDASTRLRIDVGAFDQDEWLLNCANGTVNLRKGAVQRITNHRRSDYITKYIDIPYYPGAPCHRWLEFLNTIMCGDRELIDYLQRMCGYFLCGSTLEQCLFILYGPTANNGKTTFMEVILRILGEYSAKAAITSFSDKRSGVPNDLAALAGARMVYASESGDDMRLNTGLVKEITGGESVTARFLFKEYFTFKPQFKIVIATNSIPTFDGGDQGIMRRLRIIPFKYKVTAANRVAKYEDVLLQEKDAILSWMVEGCMKWQREGLSPTSVMQDELDLISTQMDLIGRFLDECCNYDPERAHGGYMVKGPDFVRAFNQWAKANDIPTKTPHYILRKMRQKNFVEVTGDDRNPIYLGIDLKRK